MPVSSEELTAALRQHHLPPLIALIVGMASAQAQQEFNLTSPAFAQLLGRQPTGLAAFVQAVFAR